MPQYFQVVLSRLVVAQFQPNERSQLVYDAIAHVAAIDIRLQVAVVPPLKLPVLEFVSKLPNLAVLVRGRLKQQNSDSELDLLAEFLPIQALLRLKKSQVQPQTHN